MKKIALSLFVTILLSACNTLHGAGEDLRQGGQAVGHGIQKAGQAIENAAQ
ncbi:MULTISPECIES: entericidin EcnAB [Aquitalea]|uniref:entericidin EcnAB n=1 Tax=Aquitalea TaxID=407217 RepID=UPI00103B950C|nr:MULTISPECIES: entericidin EcnAB [Aquitalea]QBJ79146.1 entericidin EcnAB [Aquitalea sp. USM4]